MNRSSILACIILKLNENALKHLFKQRLQKLISVKSLVSQGSQILIPAKWYEKDFSKIYPYTIFIPLGVFTHLLIAVVYLAQNSNYVCIVQRISKLVVCFASMAH